MHSVLSLTSAQSIHAVGLPIGTKNSECPRIKFHDKIIFLFQAYWPTGYKTKIQKTQYIKQSTVQTDDDHTNYKQYASDLGHNLFGKFIPQMGTIETCAKSLKQSKFDFKRANFLKTEFARAYKPRICFII